LANRLGLCQPVSASDASGIDANNHSGASKADNTRNGALRRAAQVGGVRVPTDPKWAEPGYNPPPRPPRERRDDRSPDQVRDLHLMEREIDRDWSGDYTPELRADRVRDAEGSIASDARPERDHFADLDIRDAMTETLSIEDMRALAARRWRGRFF